MIKQKFGKHTYTDSLSPKIKPRIITCKILHESSVARFPAYEFTRAHADYKGHQSVISTELLVSCNWRGQIDFIVLKPFSTRRNFPREMISFFAHSPPIGRQTKESVAQCGKLRPVENDLYSLVVVNCVANFRQGELSFW